MLRVVSPEEMARIDRGMIEGQGISGLVLMEHAAMAVTRAVLARLQEGEEALILAGGGNNGGDGLAVYRQLAMAGRKARAALLVAPDMLRGDAKKQYEMAIASGLPVEIAAGEAEVQSLTFPAAGVLVDALLGTGLGREVSGHFRRMIERMQASALPVVAVDIPSGIDGASGAIRGAAVEAVETITFQFPKIGHLLYPGRAHAGALTIAPIGLPREEEPRACTPTAADIAALLPPRSPMSHKTDHGRAALFAGSGPYAGAALLAATAALRGGAGLLRALVPRGIHPYLAACPGAIAEPVGAGDAWDEAAAEAALPVLDWADAMALGPGMGQGAGVARLLAAALGAHKPLVLDADALNALAQAPDRKLHAETILTPHPGEMARFLGGSASAIAADPLAAAREAAARFGCTVLLKGPTTIIAAPDRPTALVPGGQPALAKGGSGDVLTGLLLAFLAQGLAAYEAAIAGAYLHLAAAEEGLRLLGSRALAPMDTAAAIECLLSDAGKLA